MEEKELEIRVFVEKEHMEGPVFAFSKFGAGAECYKGLPIYSKEAFKKSIAHVAEHIRAIMDARGIEKVCIRYAPPEPKRERAIKQFAELKEMGISRVDPKDAELIFELFRKHFPEAEYKV